MAKIGKTQAKVTYTIHRKPRLVSLLGFRGNSAGKNPVLNQCYVVQIKETTGPHSTVQTSLCTHASMYVKQCTFTHRELLLY